MQVTPPGRCFPSKILLLLLYQAGISPEPGGGEARGCGSSFLVFTRSASALGDKQLHVTLSHASDRNSRYI